MTARIFNESEIISIIMAARGLEYAAKSIETDAPVILIPFDLEKRIPIMEKRIQTLKDVLAAKQAEDVQPVEFLGPESEKKAKMPKPGPVTTKYYQCQDCNKIISDNSTIHLTTELHNCPKCNGVRKFNRIGDPVEGKA